MPGISGIYQIQSKIKPWNKGLKNPEGVHGKIRKIA